MSEIKEVSTTNNLLPLVVRVRDCATGNGADLSDYTSANLHLSKSDDTTIVRPATIDVAAGTLTIELTSAELQSAPDGVWQVACELISGAAIRFSPAIDAFKTQDSF